jgi:phage-related protein
MAAIQTSWNILLYCTSQGDSPIKDFIDSLELKAQSKVYNTINLLKEFGIRLGSPHIKKLTGTDLWELRILGTDSIRLLYIAITGKSFLLLHGFKKKTNKTPLKEIKIASNRLTDYLSRK